MNINGRLARLESARAARPAGPAGLDLAGLHADAGRLGRDPEAAALAARLRGLLCGWLEAPPDRREPTLAGVPGWGALAAGLRSRLEATRARAAGRVP